ncbi:MAG: colanic acid biosynthesis glycosyltransferase WcaL [Betaproteobacteria bacterium]|nr:colanic acid biosynthesis glycosyltransferase WcaL [Betaproteobacteria bacterium]
MRIAYVINQYPKVSHSFIRREIHALERLGFDILRIALRGWDGELADAEDLHERTQTRYVLKDGLPALLVATLRTLLTAPLRFLSALVLALRMGNGAERPIYYHFVYLAEACRLLPWCRAFGVTHLHAHFGTNSAEVAMLAHALGGPPYSFTVHGPEEFDKPEFIGMREKIRRSAFVVAISSYGRSQLYRWISHAQWPKVKVVHCGFEQSFHRVAPVPLPSAPKLVCVGRLCEQKGQLLLVEAVASLAARGIRVEVVLAGDGEMREQLEALVGANGLAKQITITGWINADRVRAEILAARALVLPSFAEGLPVVIMEAMALKRPVLTTFVAGIPELVEQGTSGWLFPAGDVAALAAAIEDAISRPADELKRMGEAAYTRVIERHSIDTEAAKLGRLFHHAGAEPAPTINA